MPPVRVAVVGVGWWGRVLADAAGRGTGLGIAACTGRSPENRATFAQSYGCRDLASYEAVLADPAVEGDRKSTRLNSSHGYISYAVFCLKKKKRSISTAPSRRCHRCCRYCLNPSLGISG